MDRARSPAYYCRSLLLSVALVLDVAACGTGRLDTVLPAAGAGGSAGVGGFGVGGDPAPLGIAFLVSQADFAQSDVIGPVNAEHFTVTGEPFAEAWRATMQEVPDSPWVAQLVVPLTKPVHAGQLLNVSFWVSCEQPGGTGECYTEYIFERASAPWEKSVTFPASAAGGWEQKSEYFNAAQGYAAGEAHMVFRLGYATQTIAIGGLELQAIGAAP